MTKDIDALVAAADALAEAVTHERDLACQDFDMQLQATQAVDAALTEYRAAREAVRKGTPPAFATSA